MKTAFASGKSACENDLHHDSVRGIDVNIKNALTDPEEHDHGRVVLALPNKVPDENGRHNDLEKRTAGNGHEFSKGPENKMSRLVDRQIDEIKKTALHRVVRDPQKVERQQGGKDELWIVGFQLLPL